MLTAGYHLEMSMGQPPSVRFNMPVRTARTRRVGLFIPHLSGGGAEKVFRRLAVGFAQAGLQVDLLTADTAGEQLEAAPSSLRLVDLGARRVAECFVPLRRYLRTEVPDVLLSTLTHANILSVWATRHSLPRRTRLILREANTLSIEAGQAPDIQGRMLPLLARRFYPRADAVVAVSRGVADDLVQEVGIPRGMVRTIYNPTFDLELGDRKQESVQHPWLSDGGDPVILSVGRLTAQKRYDLLIQAVAMASRQRPLRAIILGEGEERVALESLSRELGVAERVSLPGFVPNPYAFMARSSLYVISSAWEGFPNTLVEAMACGLRVVSTDCPSGPREILELSGPGTGRYGTVTSVGDAEGLARAILRELTLECDPIGQVQGARRFSSERAVASYLRLMESLSGWSSPWGRR